MSYNEEELTGLLANDLDWNFAKVVSLYTGKLYHFARRSFRLDEVDAEDVVQEVMMNAYNALRGYPRERILRLKLNAWMYTITKNECKKFLKKWARKQQIEIPLEELSLMREQFRKSGIDAVGDIEEFQQAFKQLTEDEQKVLILHFIDGMTYEEIGKVLDKKEGTIKSHVSRARETLSKFTRG